MLKPHPRNLNLWGLVVSRFPSNNAVTKRGSMSLQLAVIMVPVLFGFLGFALDLGRMYLIRGELNQAANAMAIAAAGQMLGTTASGSNVQNALTSANAQLYYYNFGTLQIGGSTANLTSTIDTPACFATVADAT